MKPLYSLKSYSKLLLLVLVTNLILVGCKKNSPVDEPGETDVKTPIDNAPAEGTRAELTKDSIFLYARQVYLWWNFIPDYQTFVPRKFSDYDSELFAITRYGINPTTNKPYEYNGDDTDEPKYSYISDITQQNPVAYTPEKKAAVDLEGNGNDFGLSLAITGVKTAYILYVKAVYEGSPADAAGFKRGDKIAKINGQSFGSNYDAEIGTLDHLIFNSPSITCSGTTNTNTTYNRPLNKVSYKSSPIYKDSVYSSGTKKIGYLAYARFSKETNSLPEFERVFTKFIQQGVTDLIIDLRYNGGGYVTTAENLINRIAPSSLNGKVMFIENYNKLMQEKKATILMKQPLLDGNGKVQYKNAKLVTYFDIDYSVAANTNYFQKIGSLKPSNKVVFIISSNTASASELVINSLKPHIPITLVGSTSYGKPIGFFPIRIEKYDVYFSMFETQNSNGDGKYYSGFTPDYPTADNFNYDFGDLRESSFAAAYNYIVSGKFVSEVKPSNSTILSRKMETLSSDIILQDNEYKGMIQNPNKLKLK